MPRLAEAFLADGDVATARLLRNAALRAGGEPTREMELLEVRLDLAAGAPAADPRLARLAADTDDVALEAAALLLEGAGADAPEAALADAGLLVDERRGGAGGERLRGLLASALMDAGRWDDALALVEAAPRGGPDTAALWEAFAGRLAEEAADPPFLRLIFAEGEALAAAPISAEAARAIEARRDALGFGEPPVVAEAEVEPVPEEQAWWPDSPASAGVGAPAPDGGSVAAAAPGPAPVEPAALPAAEAPDLTGPIAQGRASLEESRRRRAALAARLAEIETSETRAAADAADAEAALR